MNNYNFYVYASNGVKYYGMDIQGAAAAFLKEKEKNNYCSVGVEKNDIYACDLYLTLNGNIEKSGDAMELYEFKGDNLINVNACNIIEYYLGIN